MLVVGDRVSEPYPAPAGTPPALRPGESRSREGALVRESGIIIRIPPAARPLRSRTETSAMLPAATPAISPRHGQEPPPRPRSQAPGPM